MGRHRHQRHGAGRQPERPGGRQHQHPQRGEHRRPAARQRRDAHPRLRHGRDALRWADERHAVPDGLERDDRSRRGHPRAGRRGRHRHPERHPDLELHLASRRRLGPGRQPVGHHGVHRAGRGRPRLVTRGPERGAPRVVSSVLGMPSPLPHGSWPTPITSELVVRAAARLGEVRVDGGDVWWSEGRPAEGGRSVIVRRSADGTTTDVLPAPFNARTRVHEYGGGSWTVSDGVLWFTNFADQRLYRLDPGSDTPVPVTGEPPIPAGVRHADLVVTDDGLLAVRETHAEGDRPADVVNEIVRIAADGTTEVLVSGPDFVADPRPAPDGVSLARLQWNHPDMPWDAAQLVVRAADGTDHVLAGGSGESVVQPVWGEDLSLWWLSDRNDRLSLYRRVPHGEVELVVDVG